MANENIDYYVNALQTQDTHKRLKVAENLTLYLQSSALNLIDCGQLIDGLMPWILSSNFKVSSQGLEILGLLAYQMGPSFKTHINSTLTTIVDRLGDSKQIVRDQALDVLFKYMDPVSKPQVIFDLLVPFFNHKNWRVREVLMICLTQAINRFGASSLQISKFTPCLVKLLSDPTGQVRDTAISTLVEIYRHVGERLRTDLLKYNMQEAKLNSLFAKFDQLSKSGDFVDHGYTNESNQIPNSPPQKKKALKGLVSRSTSFSPGDKKKPSVDKINAAASGAVDETDFVTAWEEVQEPKIFSIKEFPNELDRINAILSDPNNDWEKRVDALRALRSLAKVSNQVDQFPKIIKDLENALRVSVKDLRSSVVREACVTLSYLSFVMESKFDYLAECMLPSLIVLIPNTVKIMSTSAHAAMRLIIKHTPSPRLIPLIVSSLLTAKSKDIRRRCAEYVGLLLEIWDTSVIKSHSALLEEAIKKGIADADSETRAAVRRVYWHFADHYRDKADAMMQQFDTSKQKLLLSDKNLISTGISAGGNDQAKQNKPVRLMSSSETLHKIKSQSTKNTAMGPPIAMPPMQRSASQMEYNSRTPKMTSRQKSYDDLKRSNTKAIKQEGRARYVVPKSTNSQPSSRNTSPKRAPSFSRERSEDYMKAFSPQKSRIPTPSKPISKSTSRSTSRHSSRDSSPSRVSSDLQVRNGNKSAEDNVTEDILWDALKRSGRRERQNSQTSVNGGGSDESDASSMSSLNVNRPVVTQDYDEIVHLMQQDSSHLKRDGLSSLQVFLHGNNSLSTEQVVRLKETFNRYFAEPNSKIYSTFLSVLSEFVVQYKKDLKDWLFILLTRLLQRISTDILSSSQKKIARVLDIVRDSYPYDQQFHIITKYITDNTQTPTLKLKVSLLEYLRGLIHNMDPSDFVNTAPIRLAVSRIITWISEPKSSDVRKEASLVIIALFQLNSPEFSNMLSGVPNSIHEGATRVIKMHLRQASGLNSRDVLSLSDEATNTACTPAKTSSSDSSVFRSVSPVKSSKYTTSQEYSSSLMNKNGRENNCDDNYESLNTKIPVRKLSYDDFDSPITQLNSSNPPQSQLYSYGTHYTTTEHSSPVWLSKDMTIQYNPKQYEDSMLDSRYGQNNSFVSPEMNKIIGGVEHLHLSAERTDFGSANLANEIFAVLSAPPNATDSEDIKNAMQELHKLVKVCSKHLTASKLKALLPIVLQMLQHQEAAIRCLAARCLREIASNYPAIYRSDLKGFLVPLLESEADTQREVSKTVVECCAIVNQIIPPSEIIPVIAPICGKASFPTNLSAIKMLNSISDTCDSGELRKHLDVVITNLLTAYDHIESSVRKAAVFCLVSIHNQAGANVVSPFFKDLAGSKMKLLNLYIRRSQSSNV